MKLTNATLIVAAAIVLLAGVAQAGVPAFEYGEEQPIVQESIGRSSGMLRASATPDSIASALAIGADYLQAMQADITEDNAGNGTDGKSS